MFNRWSEFGRREFLLRSLEGLIYNLNVVPSNNSCQRLRDTIDEEKDNKTVSIILRRSPFKKHANQFFRRRDGVCGWFGKFPL